MHLNESMNFIIQDLDETHLFVSAGYFEVLQEKLDSLLDENTYTFVKDGGNSVN